MKLDPVLTKAIRLLRRRKYGDVIRTLESEIFRFRDSFKYYYILGIACLKVNDFGGALDFFKRAHDIKKKDVPVLLGLAVLFMRRGSTDRAVDLYLEVQETDPKNRIAKKALKMIRKYGAEENSDSWAETGKLSVLYPPVPKPPFSKKTIFIPLLFILAAGAVFLLYRLNILNPFKDSSGSRQGLYLTMLDREERDEPVQVDGTYRYVLTRNEVLGTYAEAQKLFSQYRDEMAKVNLNRIIESNASEAVKNKARLLFSYTGEPGFDTLQDRFKYTDVLADPSLYRDCYVIWSGMAANLELGENTTAFNLLVGYDTRKTLEGIAAVTLDFAVNINTEQPLEILGKVVPVSGPGGMGLKLQGIAVHQPGLINDAGK
ncbi:MAG: tetratricopeptide repeat protein [Treponema sp.]|jgi:tetratricopeptide (TPR) repeat protein|nr:tetratricopeptide repeat protein [Treponema sp.]